MDGWDKMVYTEQHETIRIALIGFFVTLVLCSAIAGMVYTGHQNNIKDTKYAVTCLEKGGEFHTDDHGNIRCDR